MPDTTRKYASAFDFGATTAEQVLAFHRARFGDARMEGETPPAGESTEAGGDGGESGEQGGYPANTPLSEMTEGQQLAYWKHQARKHETTSKARADYDTIKAERDQLLSSTQTEAEKAVAAAREEGARAGRAEYAPRLVAAELKAALAGKIPADKLAGQIEFIDHTKFLTDTGEVDTDKVEQYAEGITPAATWPDTGQGKRGNADASGKGVAAGAEMFAASRGKKTT